MNIRKSDGSYEVFSPQKLRRGILLASDGKLSGTALDLLVSRIVNRIIRIEGVDSAVIGKIAEEELADFPSIARRFIGYRVNTEWSDNSRVVRGMSEYIARTKYCREGEDWPDCVKRLMAMHRGKYDGIDIDWGELEEAIIDKSILPSMRSLQFGGKAIERQNCRIFNCSYTPIDREEVFSEILYLLLCGCGVGYRVTWKCVSKLPAVRKGRVVLHHEIADSLEGWAATIGVLIQSYYNGYYPEFNYSRIRPEGSPLVTSGGRAPGHMGLKNAIENIRVILTRAAGRQLRPLECHDIVCHVASAVLSGGIRRSSLICLFDDPEIMYCKTPGEFGPGEGINEQRALANNSYILKDEGELERILGISKFYGEPGFFRCKDDNYGTNPCGEIGLRGSDGRGNGGVGFCNLSEVNCVGVDKEEWIRRVRLATIIGTLQAGYDDIGILKRAFHEERLIGVSLTGIMGNWELLSDPELLRRGAATVRRVNGEVASKIGIRPALRCTTVKPSGTASLLLGGVESGIHLSHARRYIRRIYVNRNEVAGKEFRAINPHMIEERGDGDYYICWPLEGRGTTKDELSAAEFLDRVRVVYENWILPGHVTGSVTHNVSCTVTVKEGEDIEAVIAKSRFLQAVSYVPDVIDKIYRYAPREGCYTEQELGRWNMLIRGYKDVEYSREGEREIGAACEGPKCEI